jgi:bilirubin oxidase
VTWEPGTATFQYENDQPPATIWYHDHVLGMTRTNVYAGPAGFYLLRQGKRPRSERDDLAAALPGPAPGVGDDPFGRYFEIAIAIQDRSFREDGSLFYPESHAFFDGFAGPFIPESDVPPIWNPEFFGNTIVTNGRTWPLLEVEPRRYRFRLLNGSDSRFLILKMVTDPLADRPAAAALPFWQIGADGGFLPEPVELDQLLVGVAERADVIVDFSGLPVGTEIFLINEGPDEPFSGGEPGIDFPPADPATTGQVMKLVVVPLEHRDRSRPPDRLRLPRFKPLGSASLTRQVSLNEATSGFPGFYGPVAALLGTLDRWGAPSSSGGTIPSPRTRPSGRPRSGRCTTSRGTPTPSTSTRCCSKGGSRRSLVIGGRRDSSSDAPNHRNEKDTSAGQRTRSQLPVPLSMTSNVNPGIVCSVAPSTTMRS